MDKEIKKGRVVLVNGPSTEVIRKASEESKQIKELNSWSATQDLITPPYPASGFIMYYEHNSTFYAVVNQIAKDVAGLGWSINLKEGAAEKKQEKDNISTFLNGVSLEGSLRNLFKEILVDWGTIGYFAIEVIRNLKGEVSKLVRIPAKTIRVHKSKEKYCQVKNEKKVWFSKFGTDKKISSTTGKETDNVEEAANEMIFYKNTCQSSDAYGIPNILPALGDVSGLVESSTYNQAFFENFGVPASIVTLIGEWEDGSSNVIKKFFETEIKGSQNGFKSLVMEKPTDGEIKIDKLGGEVKDAAFRDYQKDSKENILAVYSMPPERVGISVVGNLGGEKVKEVNEVYKNSTVEPLQCDLEYIINDLILPTLNISNYVFKFNDLDFSDTNAESERVSKLVDRGIMSPNEARKILGMDPYDGGDILRISGTTEDVGVVDNEG